MCAQSLEWRAARVRVPIGGGEFSHVIKDGKRLSTTAIVNTATGHLLWLVDSSEASFPHIIRSYLGAIVDNCSRPTMIHYSSGQFFAAHRDHDGSEADRLFVLIVCIAAPVSGGDLYFPELDFSWKMNVGGWIVFPGHFWHEARVVDVGEKLILQRYFGVRDVVDQVINCK